MEQEKFQTEEAAQKPSICDECVTNPHVLKWAGLQKPTLSNSDFDLTSNQAPAEVVLAHAFRCHDVIYSSSSEAVNYYDGSHSEDGTYYPFAYCVAGCEPSGSLRSFLATGFPGVPF
ncbi:hypothetical protein MTO96_051871 [Rhipicephalus appendiculatus]